MREKIEILRANAINAYNKADESGKKLLKDLLGDNTFKFDYKDVNTYERACAVIGEEPVDFEELNDILDNNGFNPLSAHEIAYKKLVTIAKALNLGWCPNWADFDEYKYHPWFDLKKEKAPTGVSGASSSVALGGSVLDLGDVASSSGAACGGALASESQEIAIYFGNQFAEIWQDYLLPAR